MLRIFPIFILLSLEVFAADCITFLKKSYEVPVSIGLEWEFGSLQIGKTPKELHEGRVSDWQVALPRSRFRELYAFYGKNPQGTYVKDLIPGHVLKSREFQKLSRFRQVLVRKQGDQVFLHNWRELPDSLVMPVVFQLIRARGQGDDSLRLQQVEEAWVEYQTPYDRLIPKVVAEEWRNGDFGGIEFPMQGGVGAPRQLAKYIKNLWLRLGLKEGRYRDASPEDLVGHTHVLPVIQNLPEALRKMGYDSWIGLWSELNERDVINAKTLFKSQSLESDGALKFAADHLPFIHEFMMRRYGNPEIQILSFDAIQRLRTSSQGVVLLDNSDVAPHVDRNLPRVFKRLPHGLRGSYGQPTFSEGVPIPSLGIETRSGLTAFVGLKDVPGLDRNFPRIDFSSLWKFGYPGLRGLVTNSQFLERRVQELRLHEDLISELRTMVSLERAITWDHDLVVADMLLPLQEWGSHALIMRNLSALPNKSKRILVSSYQGALNRYVQRVNHIMEARLSRDFEFIPDWKGGLPSYPDGVNRMFKRSSYPGKEEKGNSSKSPDFWFAAAIQVEAARFFRESGLYLLTDLKR